MCILAENHLMNSLCVCVCACVHVTEAGRDVTTSVSGSNSKYIHTHTYIYICKAKENKQFGQKVMSERVTATQTENQQTQKHFQIKSYMWCPSKPKYPKNANITVSAQSHRKCFEMYTRVTPHVMYEILSQHATIICS